LGNQDLERFGADVVEGVGKAVIETWNQDREHKEASGLWRRFGETIWDQLEELRTRLLEACEALGREHVNPRHAVAMTSFQLAVFSFQQDDGRPVR
jgi:hypothetical protein